MLLTLLPPPTVAGPVPVPFTINFTITNLEFVDDMSHPGSGKFNVTERILQRLVRYPPQCIKAHPQMEAALTKQGHNQEEGPNPKSSTLFSSLLPFSTVWSTVQ